MFKRIYCKVFGHDCDVHEVVYGYDPTKPAPTLYAEDHKIRSRWTCRRCGYGENSLPKPGEYGWVTLQRAIAPAKNSGSDPVKPT